MSPEKYRVVRECRICKGNHLIEYLDLGDIPLANNLITEEEISQEEKYPLKVMFCEDCFFSQLSIVVKPEILFRNYVYRSSISRSFIEHCRELAEELNEGMLKKGDLIVDIASNDGTLLRQFKEKDNRVLGIDPAVNLARIANESGIETLPDFWEPDLAKEILKKYGSAKVIIAFNVFAHVDDIHSFVEGVKTLLSDDGYFIIEAPHLLSLIKKTEFDTMYHEHLSYLLVKPLERLMRKHGMRIAKVKKFEIHGGTIRLYVEKQEKLDTSDGSAQEIILEEEKSGMYSLDNYMNFSKDVERIRRDLISKLKEIKDKGRTISAFGASAKGSVLLNYCGLGKDFIDCIFDDTPEKQNKIYPGVHIPIVAGKALLKKKPDYLLLLAWNFAKEIMQKTEHYKKRGGRYIIPIPHLKVI